MRFHTANVYIRPALLIIFIAIIVYYTYVQGSVFAHGPILTVDTPESGTMISESRVTVKGQVLHVSEVTLNSQPILIDESGHFEEELLLMNGYNIITVSAEDRFGRTVTKAITLMHEGRDGEGLGFNY